MATGAKAAQDYALKLLGHRARSEAEIRRRLEAKGFAAEEIDAAIARLKDLRFLDDPAFAVAKAGTLLKDERKGPRLAVARLEAVGIDERQAETAVEAAREGATERELVLRALEKRRPRVDAASPRPERIKAARWLAGRGFCEEAVRAALDLEGDSE